MPTTRPRHMLTESDALSAALETAAQTWPEDADSPARLLLRLIEEGHRAVAEQEAADRGLRLAIVRGYAGALSGSYGERYLEQLREDWPE